MADDSQIRIPYDEVVRILDTILLRLGFDALRSHRCARLFTDASRDGIASHGLNRFPRFVRAVRNKIVDPKASPMLVSRFGSLERWDGRSGPGNLNAQDSMGQAISIARQHGIGCVALANTNHWMRGGAYGWQAAEAGVIGICWTNTMPNLPPWGASQPRLGNNPLILAVPRSDGHVVLDIAMSQFSYGAIEAYRMRGEKLPAPGGFDTKGEMTTDPGDIEQSQRALPIGYWKGSGLALMLDLIAATLSSGNATTDIVADPDRETGLSQVFIAITSEATGLAGSSLIVDRVIADLLASGENVRYPGQRVLKARVEHQRLGVPVRRDVWEMISAL